MVIKEIQIRNFRSIVNQTIKLDQMNVFIGNNDVGKSNVLKALNLFFNSETEAGEPFNFERDFTYLYSRKSKRAKEIKISLTIEVPPSFKDACLIVWEKYWNDQGEITTKEKVYKQKDKADLPGRSRILTGLSRMKYRYVPAVKSKLYFKELLGILYDAMSKALSQPLKKPVSRLSDALKNATISLSNDIKNSLAINSTIAMPDNLREFFTTLKFNTYLDKTGITYSLNQRGDGIQSRHIPMILKYIAEQDNLSRGTGAVRVFTIWGYEEPENSLEMSKTFEMAEEIYSISRDIQTLITTHSPAFYLAAQKDGVQLFNVYQKELDKETSIQHISDTESVNNDLGVMQLVSPFIKEIAIKKDIAIEDLQNILDEVKKQNSNYKRIISETGIIDIPTIFVEGKTDRKYLYRAFELYSQPLKDMIDKNELRIIVHEEFGGVIQVGHWIEAWCRTTNQSKMLALFDNDKAAKRAREKVANDKCVQIKLAEQSVKIENIHCNDQIRNLFRKGILFEYSIEHIFPVLVWKANDSLLEYRPIEMYPELHPINNDPNASYNERINELVDDLDIKEYFIYKRINEFKKDKFCENVLKASKDNEMIFHDFKPLIEAISKFFINIDEKADQGLRQVG